MTDAAPDRRPADRFHPAHHLAPVSRLLMSADPSITRLTVRQLRYRPHRSLVMTWAARTTDAAALASQVAVVAGQARNDLNDGARRSDGALVYAFTPAEDPGLPGLATMLDPHRRCDLLAAAGVPVPPHALTLRTYRPLRRGVCELTGDSGRVFVKVVRPHRAQRIRSVHERLVDSGLPVPPVLADAGDGLVVLGAVPGTSLRAAIADGRSLPSPGALCDLLDSLPADLAYLDPVPRPCDRAREHAKWLTAVDPRFRYALDIAEAIASATGDTDDGPVVPVHGDFYEKNVLVDSGAITGLVDLDSTGAGRRIDDYATMLGHLSVLDLHSRHRRAASLGADLIRHFDRVSDRRSLRVHVAAVVLGLATGSYRVQEPDWLANTHARLVLARRWLSSAGRP